MLVVEEVSMDCEEGCVTVAPLASDCFSLSRATRLLLDVVSTGSGANRRGALVNVSSGRGSGVPEAEGIERGSISRSGIDLAH